ncbi:MAG: hypothetical protein V1859_10520 [archaeon]
MENSFINIQIEKLNYIEYRLQLFLYSFSALLLPLLIGHPQIIVGIGVNAALILSSYYMDLKGTLPIILFPSIGVLARGMIFGPMSVYLIYMIPFIWVGNAIIVYAMKFFKGKLKSNYFVSLGISSALKTAFLFGSAYLLVSLKTVPALFLTTMGTMQLVTAIIGGIAAYGIIKVRNFFIHLN